MIEHIVDKKIFQSVTHIKADSMSEHFALYRIKNAAINQTHVSSNLKVGLIIPKRWAKKAVTRNTIRRQIYAVTAKFSLEYENEMHVVRLFKAFDRSIYQSPTSLRLKIDVRRELLNLYAHDK